MGMYTGFRFSGIVKSFFREYVENCLVIGCEKELYGWEGVWRLSGLMGGFDMPFQKELSKWTLVGRKDFIPFGAMSYMPDHWGEQHSTFDKNNGEWNFICSLKNYENEIGQFIETILPYITEECYLCETLYEEYDDPRKYEFVNGIFKIVKEQSVYTEDKFGMIYPE
jgi:hypothetical protein